MHILVRDGSLRALAKSPTCVWLLRTEGSRNTEWKEPNEPSAKSLLVELARVKGPLFFQSFNGCDWLNDGEAIYSIRHVPIELDASFSPEFIRWIFQS